MSTPCLQGSTGTQRTADHLDHGREGAAIQGLQEEHQPTDEAAQTPPAQQQSRGGGECQWQQHGRQLHQVFLLSRIPSLVHCSHPAEVPRPWPSVRGRNVCHGHSRCTGPTVAAGQHYNAKGTVDMTGTSREMSFC